MSALVLGAGLGTECTTANDTYQDATVFAYQYGYPLYAYALAVQGSPNATTNSLIHQRTLVTADQRWVVRPNADTLYSRAFLDVSSCDLELHVPSILDRYWIWPFYDFYGNNVANFGSVGDFPSGTYLVRYDPDNIGVHTDGVKDGYKAYVNLPTPYALSLTRILVESASDIPAVNALQDQLSITPIARPSAPVAPVLDLGIFTNPTVVPGAQNSLEEGVLKLTAKLAAYNPPEVVEDREKVPKLLALAGCQPDGTFKQQPGTDLVAASATANVSAAALLAKPGSLIDLGGGWTIKDPKIIGDYGSYYQARAQIAAVGYLALTADEAVYPSYRYGKGVSIGARQAVLFTFAAKPQISAGGFWSLTAYDAEGYLIPNALDRYALGDRSGLTYPDGTSLSERTEGGAFQILVQPADLAPPANWTSNWLPAPVGGGPMALSMRFYGAEPSMTNGSWKYPVVEIIDAKL
ncbi:hypothetical protein BX600DRAFT_510362 [Xylariales sp. PMI_506]|nr:hypothetical protein BX600DRAFT_510362 [Xylariales sp. PMI_506]